jgi:hypothetical protein
MWWIEGGKAFAINRDGYKKHIMNVFFDEHKFRSLQTLLHKYGFRRVHSVPESRKNIPVQDIIIYEHDLFVEGDYDLSMQISRVKTSSSPVFPSTVIISNTSVVSSESHHGSISDMEIYDMNSFDCCSLASIDSLPLRSDL